MANKNFSELVARVQPNVPQCPQPMIVNHLMQAAIKTCERSLRFEKFFPMRNFALLLVSAVLCSLGLVVFTDVVRLWYRDICGLSLDLTLFALAPTKLLIVLPALEVVMSFQRGLMVAGLTTKPVTLAALIEIVAIVITLNLAIHSFHMVGASGLGTGAGDRQSPRRSLPALS